MTQFYDNLQATATTLLTRFGRDIVVRRESGGSIDPVTGAVVAGSVTDTTVKGILKTYPDRLIDGTRIKESDRMIIINAIIEPLTTDQIILGSDVWHPVEVKSSNPAGTPLVYFVQVRL